MDRGKESRVDGGKESMKTRVEWWMRVGECESKGEWRKEERENKGG